MRWFWLTNISASPWRLDRGLQRAAKFGWARDRSGTQPSLRRCSLNDVDAHFERGQIGRHQDRGRTPRNRTWQRTTVRGLGPPDGLCQSTFETLARTNGEQQSRAADEPG
jgi:hypothetical protein